MNNKPDQHNLSAVLCHERQIRKAIQNDPIKQDTNGRWRICELELMNMVYQDETLAESASDELLAKNLKKYGIIIERETRREYNGELTEYIPAEKITPTEAQQKEIGKYINAQKEARRLAYQTNLTELEQAIDPDKIIKEAQKG